LTDGKIDVKKTRPIARLGYYEYTVADEVFEMKIPGENQADKALQAGMEGRAGEYAKVEKEESLGGDQEASN
jgi:hypothetical protein